MVRLPVLLRLSLRDLIADRVLSLCLVLSLAATAAPLIVLAGLRDGLVDGLRQTLLDDPRVKEIASAGNRDYDAKWLQSLARRPDISFVIGRTRTLAASVRVSVPDRPEQGRQSELIATRAGDPLLAPAEITGDGPVAVLSTSLSASLHAEAGWTIVLQVTRLGAAAATQTVHLHVDAVAPARARANDSLFVPMQLAQAIEIYRESDLSWDEAMIRAARPAAAYPGFRLYARRLEDVPALDRALRAAGVDIVSHAGDVSDLLSLDRRLTLLLHLVALLGGAGFLANLIATQWANVTRKHRELAIMRFLGVRMLSGFPLIQAIVLSAAGIGMALAGASAVAAVINRSFATVLPAGRALCRIDLILCLDLAGLTVLAASASALAAAVRIGRIDPWEGISTT